MAKLHSHEGNDAAAEDAATRGAAEWRRVFATMDVPRSNPTQRAQNLGIPGHVDVEDSLWRAVLGAHDEAAQWRNGVFFNQRWSACLEELMRVYASSGRVDTAIGVGKENVARWRKFPAPNPPMLAAALKALGGLQIVRCRASCCVRCGGGGGHHTPHSLAVSSKPPSASSKSALPSTARWRASRSKTPARPRC